MSRPAIPLRGAQAAAVRPTGVKELSGEASSFPRLSLLERVDLAALCRHCGAPSFWIVKDDIGALFGLCEACPYDGVLLRAKWEDVRELALVSEVMLL